MSLEKYIFYYCFLGVKEMTLDLDYWWRKENFLCFIVSGLIWVYWIFSLLICLCPLHFSLSLFFFFFFGSHAFNSSLNTEKKLAITTLNPKFIVLWEVYNWNLVVGWGRRCEGVQKGGDICIPMADSCWGVTENDKIPWSYYSSTKRHTNLKKSWNLWVKIIHSFGE